MISDKTHELYEEENNNDGDAVLEVELTLVGIEWLIEVLKLVYLGLD